MNYGRYFALDLDASRIEDGISVFNYTDLAEPRVSGDNKISPEYPVFVTITPSSVKFILQYCIYRNASGTYLDLSDAVQSQEKTKGKIKISHMEEVLIELPLIETAGMSLSSVIKRLYSSPFPITSNKPEQGSTKPDPYIKQLIYNRYGVSEILRKRDKEDISYSSLYVWGLRSKEGYYKLYDDVNGEQKYTKVLRKLLLDFLFDMMHGDVFKNSAHFDGMYKALTSDYFCNSIIAKSEFYYQRAIVNALYDSEKWDKSEHNIYASYFDRAEKNWIECIQDPRSDKEYEYIPQWFEGKSVEQKSSSVFSWVRAGLRWLLEFLIPSFTINDNSWFVQPEKELQRVYFNLHKCKDRIVNLKDFAKADDKIGTFRQFRSADNELEDISIRRQSSSRWLFKRYDFRDAFRLTFFPASNALLWLIASVVICLTLSHNLPFDIIGGIERGLNWLFSGELRDWASAPKIIKYVAGTSILVAVIWTLCYSISRGRLASVKVGLRSGFISFLSIALIAIALSTEIVVLKWGLILFIVVVLFKARVFNNVLSYLHLTFPRLVASIAAAWLTVALSEDLYKAFFDSQWSPFFMGMLILLMFVFVLYEVDKIVPRVNSVSKLLRSMELMIISFIISLGVGLIVINFTGERLLARSGYLPEFYRDHVLLKHEYESDGESLSLDFDAIDWTEYIDKYTLEVLNENDSIAAIEADRFIKTFAETRYEGEFLERIAAARDSSKIHELVEISDTTKGKFLLRHENSFMFKDLLQHLEFTDKGHEHNIARYVTISKPDSVGEYKFFILYDFLIQFAVVAMFIGIFIQMIFEEKNITES